MEGRAGRLRARGEQCLSKSSGVSGLQAVPPLGAWDTSNGLAPSLLPSLSGAGAARGTQPTRRWEQDIIAISQKSFCSSGQGQELRVAVPGLGSVHHGWFEQHRARWDDHPARGQCLWAVGH